MTVRWKQCACGSPLKPEQSDVCYGCRTKRVVAAAKAVHGNVDWVSGDLEMAELGAAVEALEEP